MNKLFANTNVNLKIAIESLTDDDMQIMYGVQTFYKGKSYYTQKLVASSNYSANLAKLTAIVRGSREYKVTLELDNENIIGECTCPVGDECKHQAAVLFYARSEKIDVEIERNERADHLTHAHLESLSKSELIKLVIQYAPSNFFIKIKNISSGKPEALTVFKKVKKVIEQLFDDPENLYEPYEAMDVIGKQLNKLSELESQLHPELESFIFFIMQKVNEAQDEGYLYDSYSDGPFESPEELDTLVKNYAASLPYEDKKLFLYKLDQALTKAEYDTFSHLNDLTQNLFTEADLPELNLATWSAGPGRSQRRGSLRSWTRMGWS